MKNASENFYAIFGFFDIDLGEYPRGFCPEVDHLFSKNNNIKKYKKELLNCGIVERPIAA